MTKIAEKIFSKRIIMTILIVLFCFSSALADNLTIDLLRKYANESISKKDYLEAIKYTEEALRISEKKYGKESILSAELLAAIGLLWEAQGKFDLGAEYISRANQIRKKINPKGIPIGPQTEAFFDRAMKPEHSKRVVDKQAATSLEPYYHTINLKSGYTVSKNEDPHVQHFVALDPNVEYDFNEDGKFDGKDIEVMKNFIGKCAKDGRLPEPPMRGADVDVDSCITKKDLGYIRYKLEKLKKEKNYE